MLLNIVLFLPNKSCTSNYCLNALLKLHFWPLFWSLLLLLPPPDHCFLKLPLLSHCPLTAWLPSLCPLKPGLPSCCPQKLQYPSHGPSSSGCSMGTESFLCCESCHFSCTSVTDAVGISKQTPCFLLKRTIPFTLESMSLPSCSLSSLQAQLMSDISVEHHKIMVTKPASELMKERWSTDMKPEMWARALAGLPRLPSPQSLGDTETKSLMACLLDTFIYFFKFYFIFKLYNIVLVLPNIEIAHNHDYFIILCFVL